MRMGLNKKLVVISSPYPWYTFNVIADSESEKFNDASEWMVPAKISKALCNLWAKMRLIFLLRLNFKLTKYFIDPGSVSIDAIYISWS